MARNENEPPRSDTASLVRRRRTTAFVVGLAILVVIAVFVRAGSTTEPRYSLRPVTSTDPIPGSATDQRVLALVARAAAGDGEPHPTHIQWLATTRGVAFELMGEPQGPDGTDLDRAVIYMQAFGTFTLVGPVPRHARGGAPVDPPHGSCLQMAKDRTTDQVLDSGVGAVCADLSGMNGVHTVG
jgi:hypothetical protein